MGLLWERSPFILNIGTTNVCGIDIGSGLVREFNPSQKRKGRQNDCLVHHCGRWSLPSTSRMMIRAVILTTFPFLCLRLQENGWHFADGIIKLFILYENLYILIQISQDPVNNKPALVQAMAWRGKGEKTLPEPMIPQFTSFQWIEPLKSLQFSQIDLWYKENYATLQYFVLAQQYEFIRLSSMNLSTVQSVWTTKNFRWSTIISAYSGSWMI